MTGSDDIILEFLAESGKAHNLQGIVNNFKHENTSISYSTVQRRLPKLVDGGLIEIIDQQGTYYKITELGEAYLDGEVDLSDSNLGG